MCVTNSLYSPRIPVIMPPKEQHLPAVQMVKTTCTESKKKNMTSRDTEAPIGRNSACVESIV